MNFAKRKPIKSWWIALLRGVLLIVLGIWMLKMPVATFSTVSVIIGLILSLSGLIEAGVGIYYRNKIPEWYWNVLAGCIDIIIGLFLITNPKAILMIITLVISFWITLRGILIIKDALELKRNNSKNWGIMLAAGILVLIIAVILIWHPQIIGLTIVFWIAISFIFLGIFRVFLAFKKQKQDASTMIEDAEIIEEIK